MSVVRVWNQRRRGLLLSAALVWAVAGLAPAIAQERPYIYGGHMWDGGWWLFFGPVWMILSLVVVIGVVVMLVRWLSGSGEGGSLAARAPLDILRERFARGEINKDDFEERKRVLAE